AAQPATDASAKPEPSSGSAAGVAAPEPKKPESQTTKPQSDAEKIALEKKLAEAEKKLAEERKAAEKSPPKSGAPVSGVVVAPPQPVLPQPPAAEPARPAGNDACVTVIVKGRDGQPVSGMKVGVIEQSSGPVSSGRTGPLGRWQGCGLTSGSRVSVGAFGPRGKVMGGRQGVVLTRGQNVVEIQVNRVDDADYEPIPGPNKRRFPRQ